VITLRVNFQLTTPRNGKGAERGEKQLREYIAKTCNSFLDSFTHQELLTRQSEGLPVEHSRDRSPLSLSVHHYRTANHQHHWVLTWPNADGESSTRAGATAGTGQMVSDTIYCPNVS
jgi:hypothetical protein